MIPGTDSSPRSHSCVSGLGLSLEYIVHSFNSTPYEHLPRNKAKVPSFLNVDLIVLWLEIRDSF